MRLNVHDTFDAALSLLLRGVKSVGLLVILAAVSHWAAPGVGPQFALLVSVGIWVSIAAAGHISAELARRCNSAQARVDASGQGAAALVAVVVVASLLALAVAPWVVWKSTVQTTLLFVLFVSVLALQNVASDVVRLVTRTPKASLFSGWGASYVAAGCIWVLRSATAEVSIDAVLAVSTIVSSVGLMVAFQRIWPSDWSGFAGRVIHFIFSIRGNAGITIMGALIPSAPVIVGALGPGAEAEYSFAQRLAAPILMPAWAIASVMLPKLSSAIHRGESDSVSRILRACAFVGFASAATLALTVVLLGNDLLILVGGRQVLGATDSLMWLLFGAVCYASGYGYFQAAFQRGEIRQAVTTAAAVSLACLVLALRFTVSSESAAICVVLAQLLVLIFAVVSVSRRRKLDQ